MTDGDQKRSEARWPGLENDALDRELNAALEKYAAVEPRPGLEERVLANLRAAREECPDRACWRWTAAAAAVGMVLVALAVSHMWRSSKPNRAAHHPAITLPQQPTPPSQDVAGGRIHIPPPSAGRTSPHRPHASAVVAAEPKLDQFPSPHPLTEEERLLADYIERFQDEAVLVARARAEELKREHIEEGSGEVLDGTGSAESNQQINNR